MRSIFDKVVSPDVVGICGTQANAGSVVEPKALAFGLFGGHFEPLIIGAGWLLALRGAMLAKNSASKPLRDAMLAKHMLHTGTATCGA